MGHLSALSSEAAASLSADVSCFYILLSNEWKFCINTLISFRPCNKIIQFCMQIFFPTNLKLVSFFVLKVKVLLYSIRFRRKL